MIPIMLTLYRAHARTCPHHPKGRAYRKCQCPIWIDGMHDGERVNHSLKTRTWTIAETLRQDIERGITPSGPIAALPELCEGYLRDCEARKLAPSTLKRYRAILLGTPGAQRDRGSERYTVPLAQWAGETGLAAHRISTVDLTTYRETWRDSAVTSRKRLEALRAFFAWLVARATIRSNPAKGLKPPKQRTAPKLPYTTDEVLRLLQTCAHPWPDERKPGPRRRAILRALMLVLRYTGLRIGDALQLTPGRFDGQRLFLRAAKTSQPVFVPVPQFLLDALAAMPMVSVGWYFWDGRQDIDKAADRYRKQLLAAGALAGVADVEFHRFRDTFAVELLAKGVSIETVAVLLGHADSKITARHYAPWVRARQEALEREINQALIGDVVARMESRDFRDGGGTKEASTQ